MEYLVTCNVSFDKGGKSCNVFHLVLFTLTFEGYLLQVAEKRKGLLDEMAIEKQTAETNHKQQLEKLQEEHKVSQISPSNGIVN